MNDTFLQSPGAYTPISTTENAIGRNFLRSKLNAHWLIKNSRAGHNRKLRSVARQIMSVRDFDHIDS